MRRREGNPSLLAAALALAAFAAPVHGQDVSELRVRQAIEDAAGAFGQAIAGGSPLTGPASMTGGPLRLRLGASVGFTDVEIEDPQSSSGTVGFVLPAATVNGAVGILGGGANGFGAVDLIGRAGPVLPREEIDESPLLLSLGARIGVLQGGLVFPDVSVSIARAWTDEIRYGEGEDEVSFEGDVRTWSGRADVSKTFLLATPYAGAGFDRGTLEVDYRIPAARSTGGEEIRGRIDTADTRGRAYAGVELALALLGLSVEVGTAGGDRFGAVGARLGF